MDEHRGCLGSHGARGTRGAPDARKHARPVRRAEETDQEKSRNRAPARPYVIGKAGRSARATLVKRACCYTVPVALPADRRDATTTANALIGSVNNRGTRALKEFAEAYCTRSCARRCRSLRPHHLIGELSRLRLENRVVAPSVRVRGRPGTAPLPCHADGQFEYGRPWHTEASRPASGTRLAEGRTMRNRPQGSRPQEPTSRSEGKHEHEVCWMGLG